LFFTPQIADIPVSFFLFSGYYFSRMNIVAGILLFRRQAEMPKTPNARTPWFALVSIHLLISDF